jgi:hypothetical protein
MSTMLPVYSTSPAWLLFIAASARAPFAVSPLSRTQIRRLACKCCAIGASQYLHPDLPSMSSDVQAARLMNAHGAVHLTNMQLLALYTFRLVNRTRVIGRLRGETQCGSRVVFWFGCLRSAVKRLLLSTSGRQLQVKAQRYGKLVVILLQARIYPSHDEINFSLIAAHFASDS